MGYESLVYAPLTIAVGLVVLAVGRETPSSERFRSGGRFDLGAGLALVVFGGVMAVMGLTRFGEFYPLFLADFLIGLYVLRQYVVLAPEPERDLDVLYAALFAVPGLGGMVGVVLGQGYVALLFLPILVTSLAGVMLLLYDGLLLVTGDDIYRRDVVAPLLMLPQWWFYLLIVLADFYPPP